MGLGSPPGLLKLQSTIAGVKTPHLAVFFISLESYWSVHVEMALHEPFRHLQHKLWQKEGLGVKMAVWLPTIKSRESTLPRCVQVECDTRWKALKESYKFAWDLIPIEGLNKELWARKVPGVQTKTILRLFLGNPWTKSHSDVGVVDKRREYYMGEGGGFPRVRAMVSHVSLGLPMAHPSTKGVPKSELTNMWVGLMQVQVSN
jgi:hypothetical protein